MRFERSGRVTAGVGRAPRSSNAPSLAALRPPSNARVGRTTLAATDPPPVFYSLDRILADLPMIREFAADDRAWFEADGLDWPYEPEDVVPVLSTGELMLVDSGSSAHRGRVCLHPAPSDAEPAFEMVPSLADAIDAARYCVEAGYWVPNVIDG